MSVHASRIAGDMAARTVQMAASEREQFRKDWKEVTEKLKASGYRFDNIKLIKKEG